MKSFVCGFFCAVGEIHQCYRHQFKKKSYVLPHHINMPLFIPSPVGGHLGCFDFLAFVNKAAVNMIVHVFGVYIHSFLLVIYL